MILAIMKKLFAMLLGCFILVSFVLPEEEEEQPLSIQLAIESQIVDAGLEKNIPINSKGLHFYILVRNSGENNVSIWRENNPWGYDNFFFEVLDKNENVVFTIKKQENMRWADDTPVPLIIQPGETYVREVNFNDRFWTIPHVEDLPQGSCKHQPEVYRESRETLTLTMRAVLQIKEGHDEINNWTGSIRSEKEEVTLVFPWKPTIQHVTE